MINSLPLPDEISGVLSFEFDGTLHDPDSEPMLEPRFFELLRELRERGWVWGVNTGRSQMQTMDGLREVNAAFLPDFLIARERELYTPGQFGRWLPVVEWNKRSEKDHKRMFRKAKKVLRSIREHVESETNARWVAEVGDPAGVISSSVEEMHESVKVIERERAKCDLLGYLRNSIYLRFSHKDYHKGTSLAEISRLCNVTRDRVFAMGDGHNDIDMLHRDFAHMIACPANAHEEVISHIRSQDGYICKQATSRGVIEALEHFLL